MKNLFLFISLFLLPFAAKSQDEVASKINSHIRSTNNTAPVKRDTLAGVLELLNKKANAKQDTGIVGHNMYYVDKQWSTPAQRQSQNARAKVGNPMRPFAEPWSARNAAIALGGEPTIYIQAGNIFTASDFNPVEHDKTVSIAGTNHTVGVELAYHGITYRFDGATIGTPLMNAAFLSAQATNGFTKKAIFTGGIAPNLGTNSNAQSNVEIGLDEACVSNINGIAGAINGDAGLKKFYAKKTGRTLILGSRWNASNFGDATALREKITYTTEFLDKPSANGGISLTKIHNKDVEVRISTVTLNGLLFNVGHPNASAGDGLASGLNGSTLYLKIENAIVANADVNVGATVMEFVNNSNSTVNAELCNFGTISTPNLINFWGGQASNQYNITNLRVKINAPAATSPPINVALSTSTATIDGDITSNVNANFIQVASGTLKLKGRYVQRAAGKSVIDIAAGAKVICDCELTTDGVTPTVTGGGTFIAVNARMNVAPSPSVSVVGTPQVSSGFNY